MIVKFPMLWGQGGFSDSVGMWTLFIPASHLGGDHTRRYWDLDRQGGCENILEGLVSLMTMMER